MKNEVEIHNVGPFILGKTLGSGTTGKIMEGSVLIIQEK